MNTLRSLKKQNGSYIAEIAVGLLVVLSLAAYGLSKNETVAANGDESVLVSDIGSIANGARKYRRTVSDGYATISMTKLSTDGYVAVNLGDGTGKNPFGGNYTIAKNTADAGKVDITSTNVPTEICNRVEDMFTKVGTASCNSGTVVITTL